MFDLNIIFQRCWNSKQTLNEGMKLLEGFFMTRVSIAKIPTSEDVVNVCKARNIFKQNLEQHRLTLFLAAKLAALPGQM